jgi:V8-like Glu-specific endopeptidase
MIPSKTRVENTVFRPVQAEDVNIGVIGHDERKPWTNTLDRPYRWICKLGMLLQSWKSRDFYYAEGSGVFVGNRHVLTCAHNLIEPVLNDEGEHVDTGEARAVVVIPGLNGIHDNPKMVMPFGWTWGSTFRTTTDSRNLTCRHGYQLGDHDFAVVKLVNDFGNHSYPLLNDAKFGYWSHPSLGSNTLMKFKKANSIRGVPVNIIGYPADRCRDRPLGRPITQRELNDCTASDWASVPWISFDNIVDPGHDGTKFDEMRVKHDLAPGMSGSPVWIRWKGFRNMLGLARAATLAPDARTNFVVRFTETALKEISSWIE